MPDFFFGRTPSPHDPPRLASQRDIRRVACIKARAWLQYGPIDLTGRSGFWTLRWEGPARCGGMCFTCSACHREDVRPLAAFGLGRNAHAGVLDLSSMRSGLRDGTTGYHARSGVGQGGDMPVGDTVHARGKACALPYDLPRNFRGCEP